MKNNPAFVVIGSLAIWTIYGDPSDFPGKFVVRRWDVTGPDLQAKPEPNAIVVDTLDDARGALPAGLRNIGRYQQDDTKIVENWL